MVKFDILKNIVRDCSEKRGIDEYELYYSESSNIGASTFRDELNSFSSGVGGSLLYRCIVGGKIGYASTQLLDESEMEKLVERALENASVIEKDEEAIIFEGAPADEYRSIPEISFELPSASVIRERIMKNRDLLYAADERIADGTSASVSAGQSRTFLFNSKGLDLSSSGGSLTESFYTVLDNGSEKKTGGERLYNSLDRSDAERREKIAKAVKEASDKFGAGAVRSGRYNIVFKNEQMEQILDTFASVFFADKVQKGLSLLKGKVGEKIASECITITDDPFAEDNVYQHSFDGEGVPTYCKNVVENGVLKTYLYNLASAKKDGVKTTGNASRGSSSIGTRVYTFYINKGEMTRDELLKKAGSGIYVTYMKGFHAGANSVTGDFSIESEGFMFEDGKLTRPVKSFTVAGNFFDLLKQITDVDNELDFGGPAGSRICAPDVLVPDMQVAGE